MPPSILMASPTDTIPEGPQDTEHGATIYSLMLFHELTWAPSVLMADITTMILNGLEDTDEDVRKSAVKTVAALVQHGRIPSLWIPPDLTSTQYTFP